MGQALVEVSVFALLIQTTERKWLQNIYCSLFFTLWIVHFTNFNMLRLLDTSLLYLFKFFVGHGIFHIIQVFQAINMNEAMMGFIGIVALAIPLLAISLYRITHYFSKKKPLALKNRSIVISLLTTVSILLVCEAIIIPSLSYKTHEKYKKTLPFARTLFSPKINEWTLTQPIAAPHNREPLLDSLSLSPKPNIYLFVIETLRKDFLIPSIAPSLCSFEEKHMQFPVSFANANATQHSWFAIFHSQFPYHWTKVQSEKRGGGGPLQILKKLGYQIHVYSSADLRYFEMDELLFGPQRILADTIEEYTLESTMPAWERDALCFQAFKQNIQKQGHVYLFFLDATHSEYNFPKEFASHFTPITDKIDYLFFDKEHLELVKNRYRNAIAYVDSLMDDFFSTLKKEGIYDEAIIAITGDHGEEFFEEGSLFHGTHLNHYQTNVPIFLKLQNTFPLQTKTVTHIDIFPSILHSLTGKEMDVAWFDGRSVFSSHQHPYRLATLQNGAQTPEEFTLENDKYKIRAHFSNPQDLYTKQTLKIISCETSDSVKAPLPEDAFEMLY